MEEKKELEKALSILADEGFDVAFPVDYDHPDGINVDYEASVPKDFLKLVKKARKRGFDLSLIPGSLSYEQMMREADHLESAIYEYTSADGALKDEFTSLREFKVFSRLPDAQEKLIFFRSVHAVERDGSHLDYADLAILAEESGADYVTDVTMFRREKLESQTSQGGTKSSKGGCSLLLFLFSASILIAMVVAQNG